jgi:hypothetical protein
MADLTPRQQCQVDAIRRYLGGRRLLNERVSPEGVIIWDVDGMPRGTTVSTSVQRGAGQGGGDITSSTLTVVPSTTIEADKMYPVNSYTVTDDGGVQTIGQSVLFTRGAHINQGFIDVNSGMPIEPDNMFRDKRFDELVGQCGALASYSSAFRPA